SNTQIPLILTGVVGECALVEQLDINDRSALLALGQRHRITGIVHLADPAVASIMGPAPADAIQFASLFQGLGNILDAAREWKVDRVTVVSTIGVYMGAGNGPWHEDTPLPINSFHGIPVMKKVAETLTGFAAETTGISMISVRPSGI